MHSLTPDNLPRHVAIIMDGNGRWAQKRLLNRIVGHEEGATSVREVVRSCRKLGIRYLTLYAFSKENWQRPQTEVSALWQLLKRFLRSERAELLEKEIRLCHVGDRDGIPADVVQLLQEVIAQTAHCDKLILSLAINYGGRQEIIRAAQQFAARVRQGLCEPSDLSSDSFSQYLFTSQMPDPDLVIRTSGEFRVSNFLLWQIAYAEFYITEVLWPDFREAQFLEALHAFQHRERRFGKTGEQINQPV